MLDQPDVFAFPSYPKTLGEMIAADDQSNQFFLTRIVASAVFMSSLVWGSGVDPIVPGAAPRATRFGRFHRAWPTGQNKGIRASCTPADRTMIRTVPAQRHRR